MWLRPVSSGLLHITWAIDLFGQFPFTTEADGVGKFFPEIGSRTEIFNYIESELLDIENKLGAPKSHILRLTRQQHGCFSQGST
jgi:hypothetical protein